MSSPNQQRKRRPQNQRDSVEPDTPTPKRKPRQPSQSKNEAPAEEEPPTKAPEKRSKKQKAAPIPTESTERLILPGSNGRTSSSPRHSRRLSTDPSSSSSGDPLRMGSLAQLNAINDKKDRKSGWNTYDEAYLQDVRAREKALEDVRQQVEKTKGRKEEKKRQRQEDEAYQSAREQVNERAREDRQRARRTSKPIPVRLEMTEVDTAANIRTRRLKYEKLDEKSFSKTDGERGPKKKKRAISGPYIEDGRAEEVYRPKKTKKRKNGGPPILAKLRNRKIMGICLAIVSVVTLAIVIAVAVVVSKSKSTKSSNSSPSTPGKPPNSNLNGINPDSIPAYAQGGPLDPFSWWDTADFNVTFTNATVGGLPLMGLNSTWDDSVQANSNVPPLNKLFGYGSLPIRGINVGGWLSLEPFITPSFFSKPGVIDEWTLTTSLGSSAASTIEPHYSSFITEQTFKDIRAAGFDHVRIPFSYWAINTFSGDPYVPKVSWRYLLRGIEYARQNGLRVNLDLHAAPGSQNGWNHSGRQGVIGWLNGTDGDLNAQRTLDFHDQLSQFFSQPRYQNIITMYGLVNEPRMVVLDIDKVVTWTTNAIQTVRKNNLKSILAFGDGFLGLDKWQGVLQGYDDLLLDVHQYVIFNDGQISLNHSAKLNFACGGWTAQILRSQNKATGFGPTICGEWSQADTDCTQYINDVGVGSRWEGTLNEPDPSMSVLSPQCPSSTTGGAKRCECKDANADPSQYSAVYKQWLMAFALAQMESFEEGWGWFYWTWVTESAAQWSYKTGMQAGILPSNVADRSAFTCNSTIPDYAALGLPEYY